MYKALHEPARLALHPLARPPDAMRQRALELVLIELKHQPMLKLRAFACGLLVGAVLVAGLGYGYHQGVERAALAIEDSVKAVREHIEDAGAH